MISIEYDMRFTHISLETPKKKKWKETFDVPNKATTLSLFWRHEQIFNFLKKRPSKGWKPRVFNFWTAFYQRSLVRNKIITNFRKNGNSSGEHKTFLAECKKFWPLFFDVKGNENCYLPVKSLISKQHVLLEQSFFFKCGT